MPWTRDQHQPQLLRLFPFFLKLVYWIVKHSGSKWKGVGKKTSCHISKISIFCLREACGDLKKLGFSARCREMWNLNCITQLKSWALFHTCKLVHLPSLSSPFSQLSVRGCYKIPSPFFCKKKLHSCALSSPGASPWSHRLVPCSRSLLLGSHSLWGGCSSLLTNFLPSAGVFWYPGTWGSPQVMPCSGNMLCPSPLWDVSIPCRACCRSCCATYCVWIEPGLLQFQSSSCTDMLVLTTIKSDILIFAVY